MQKENKSDPKATTIRLDPEFRRRVNHFLVDTGMTFTAAVVEGLRRLMAHPAPSDIGVTTDTQPEYTGVQSGSHAPNNPELNRWLALTEKILTSADPRTRMALLTNISEFARLAQLAPVEPAEDESHKIPAPDDLAEAARRIFESARDADDRGEEDSGRTGTGG